MKNTEYTERSDSMNRPSMLFYKSYIDAVERIPDEGIQYKLLKGIIYYGLTGEADIPDDPLSQMAWTFIEPLVGANIRNYINGKKGGAPSESMQGNTNAKKGKQTQNKPGHNRNQTQNESNVNDKDNVKGNDKDNVKDKDNVNVNVKDNVKDKDKDKNLYIPGSADPNSFHSPYQMTPEEEAAADAWFDSLGEDE